MARLALLLVVLVALAAGCGGDDDADEAAGGDTVATTAPEPTVEETEPPAAAAGECREVAQPEPRPDGGEQAPTEDLDAAKTYTVTVTTSCGPFTVTLDPEASPKAVASFVALARDGFFDGTSFHRIVPGFVIQGGDPTGTGTGGPGYQTVDTPDPGTTYPLGTVAMAKAGTDPPGAAGSQFFVVTAETGAPLPPEYAVVGHVTGGEDVVEAIGQLGDPATEQPTQPVTIDEMVVKVS